MRPTLSRSLSGKRLTIVVAAVLCLAVSTAHIVRGQQRDQLPKYGFTVEISGLTLGAFQEVSGLAFENDVVEYRDGGSNVIRKLPGLTKYPNLVLKRGFTGDRALYDWAMASVLTGNVIRRQVTVTLQDPGKNPIAVWTFENGWPAKWELSELDTSKAEVAIESLEIAHEGLTLSDDEP